MARPKKRPVEKKTDRFPTTRCTAAELAEVRKKADAANLPVTAYIRMQALEGAVEIAAPVIEPAVLLELQRIGNNLNQAVKKFHQTGKPPAELEATALRVNRFLDLIIDEIV